MNFQKHSTNVNSLKVLNDYWIRNSPHYANTTLLNHLCIYVDAAAGYM